MSVLDYLPPRAWTDLAEPVNPPDEASDTFFDFYTEWLADYLFETDIPIHERQKDYADYINKADPEHCIFSISDTDGSAFDELDDLQGFYEYKESEDWPSYQAMHRQIWDEHVDEETKQDEPFEEWSVTQETWKRCREEWLEKKQLILQKGELPNRADLPYRALLAVALKRMPDREKRIAAIRNFFWNRADNMSK
jgi:hypothetical protein